MNKWLLHIDGKLEDSHHNGEIGSKNESAFSSTQFVNFSFWVETQASDYDEAQSEVQESLLLERYQPDDNPGVEIIEVKWQGQVEHSVYVATSAQIGQGSLRPEEGEWITPVKLSLQHNTTPEAAALTGETGLCCVLTASEDVLDLEDVPEE
jgi:hypothetical protein